MKQAILITAYTQLEFLNEIIGFFDEDFDFYIHIDKKTKIGDLTFLDKPNVKVYSKFRIQWGSEKHLRAIVFLMEEAWKNGNYSYYHLITGSDYPIKPLAEFKSFFGENNKNNYMEWYELPRATWVMEGGLERVKYYWIGNSQFDIRGKVGKYVYKIVKLQRKLGVERKFVRLFPKLYGGGGYWSLTSDAVGHVVKTINDNKLLKYIKHTHCAEEVFLHTLLLNAEQKFPVVNDSIRYSKWEGNARSPKVLDESDFEEVIVSGCFFARKFSNEASMDLIERIKTTMFCNK